MTIPPVQTQSIRSAVTHRKMSEDVEQQSDDPPSLSKFYPPETAYFYSFPSGEDSNFFNGVSAWKEELVAARPLVCAGDSVRAVTFFSSVQDDVWNIMTQKLGIPLIPKDHVFMLPRSITARLTGATRNSRIKFALRELLPVRQLVMAQPYIDHELLRRYQIPPELIVRLNDKSYRSSYIPKRYLPETYAAFPNGEAFAA